MGDASAASEASAGAAASTGSAGRSGPRTRAEVVRAALEILDTDGIGALSMRRVAARLGVTPMALYNHVSGKGDLIAAVVDAVLGDLDLPSSDAPWRQRLRGVFLGLRRQYLRHPNVLPLVVASTTVSPAQLQPMETALQALADAGLPPDRARAAWTALIGLTNGHVAYQLRGHLAPEAADAVAPDLRPFPRVATALAGGPPDHDAAFEAALDALIAGFAPGR